MGSNDGSVLGAAKILDNGDDALRFNIVFVAEGFRAAEQGAFDALCTDFAFRIQGERWFQTHGRAINLHRINVASTESGADEPASCPDHTVGSGKTAATYFDATFCSSTIRRTVGINQPLVRSTLASLAPRWHVAAVLVNTTLDGGAAMGNVLTTTLSSRWKEVLLHEIGHAAFGLADEYPYWRGCGLDTNRDHAPAGEPTQPNITAERTLATLKWRAFVGGGVAIPTATNPDCTKCPPGIAPAPPPSVVGLFEGAGYYHCGFFRPTYACRMRDTSFAFCAVCEAAIRGKLEPFL